MGFYELDEYTPRDWHDYAVEFEWDDCGLSPPDIDCNDEEWNSEEAIGSTIIQTNINFVDEVVIENIYEGSCWGDDDWTY